MIICSCNVISVQDIERAAERIRERDPDTILTPGLVYKEIGYNPKCCVCLSQIVQLVYSTKEKQLRRACRVLPLNETADALEMRTENTAPLTGEDHQRGERARKEG